MQTNNAVKMQQKANKTQTRGKLFSERSKTRLSASDWAIFQKIIKVRSELFPGSHGLYQRISNEVAEKTGSLPAYGRVAYTMTGRKIYPEVADAFFSIAKQEREKAAQYLETV